MDAVDKQCDATQKEVDAAQKVMETIKKEFAAVRKTIKTNELKKKFGEIGTSSARRQPRQLEMLGHQMECAERAKQQNALLERGTLQNARKPAGTRAHRSRGGRG